MCEDEKDIWSREIKPYYQSKKAHGLVDNYDIRIVIATNVNYYLELNQDK